MKAGSGSGFPLAPAPGASGDHTGNVPMVRALLAAVGTDQPRSSILRKGHFLAVLDRGNDCLSPCRATHALDVSSKASWRDRRATALGDRLEIGNHSTRNLLTPIRAGFPTLSVGRAGRANRPLSRFQHWRGGREAQEPPAWIALVINNRRDAIPTCPGKGDLCPEKPEGIPGEPGAPAGA